jgi:hypothetical protein
VLTCAPWAWDIKGTEESAVKKDRIMRGFTAVFSNVSIDK